MKNENKYILVVLSLVIFTSCNIFNHQTPHKSAKISTLEGYFLYECNAPYNFFTRFDQIECSNRIIFYDSILLTHNIEQLYKRGILYLSAPPDYLPANEKFDFRRDTYSIWDFQKAASYDINQKDTIYANTLLYDKTGLLYYKKFYARFDIIDMGNYDQKIPKIRDYKCCYSNSITNTHGYFIKKILEFKLY